MCYLNEKAICSTQLVFDMLIRLKNGKLVLSRRGAKKITDRIEF